MGSRSTRPGNEKVYEAADEWVKNALRTAGSLFNSGSILTPTSQSGAVNGSVNSVSDS